MLGSSKTDEMMAQAPQPLITRNSVPTLFLADLFFIYNTAHIALKMHANLLMSLWIFEQPSFEQGETGMIAINL